MSRKFLWLVAVLAIAAVLLYTQLGVRPSVKPDSSLSLINIPEGFRISVFADNLGSSSFSLPGPNTGPRMMLLKGNTVFVSLMNQGKTVALPDKNSDGTADEQITFIDNLNKPHGIEYYDGWFYIAEETEIIRVRDDDNNNRADLGTIEVVIDSLPTSGHFTRTVKVHNNSLYFSMGSSCNVCYETDERRAAINKCNLDGTVCQVFAKGLRNSVGFVFREGKIYATDNGRDLLGDDVPPDDINVVEEGNDYGWPICYGNKIHDDEFDKNVYVRDPCADSTAPLVKLQAHSAPLGLAFYEGSAFPEEYKNDLFVAFHGSWNRNEPTGYKVVRIDFPTLEVKDFATGWLQGSNVLGRPVDIIEAGNSLLVSDDNAGKIYRIWYGG